MTMMIMVASAMLSEDWHSSRNLRATEQGKTTIYVFHQGVRGLTCVLWDVSHDGSGS